MTHKEIFEALLAGKVLAWKSSDVSKIRMNEDGNIIMVGAESPKVSRIFNSLTLGPDVWSIETPWYERIPQDGVLCWVSDLPFPRPNTGARIALCTAYDAESEHPFITDWRINFKYATHVKRPEVNFLEDLE